MDKDTQILIDEQRQELRDVRDQNMKFADLTRRRSREVKEVTLTFSEGDGIEFHFSASLEALKDPDIRDALAKGRALLESIAGRKKAEDKTSSFDNRRTIS